jgi:tripartite-type tricarboxylate transporter receptor subunit TctC
MRCRMLVLAGALALGATGAAAQTYPTRTVQMIVPFPPGGNTDIMARALQNELSKALGGSVIVINKGGAAGTIGIIDTCHARDGGHPIDPALRQR